VIYLAMELAVLYTQTDRWQRIDSLATRWLVHPFLTQYHHLLLLALKPIQPFRLPSIPSTQIQSRGDH